MSWGCGRRVTRAAGLPRPWLAVQPRAGGSTRNRLLVSPLSPPDSTALPAKHSFAHFSFYTYMITFLRQSSQTLLILLFDEKHFSQLCLVIELDVLCSPVMHVVTRDLFHACCSPVSLSILDALQENSMLFPRGDFRPPCAVASCISMYLFCALR